MKPDTLFSMVILLAVILDSIIFVAFGQKTVRKLRKNPNTKEALGVAFMSGWDIFNVTIAFGFPRKMNRLLRKTVFAPFNADADLLEKYMTRFDVILAKVHFSLWMSLVIGTLIFMILCKIGVVYL
jgi:hypothetical protein